MVELDGYIDFDGTLTTSHSHFGLDVMGAKKELSKILKLGYYGLICLYKDKTGLDISSELEEMATVLEGLTFSRTSDLVEKMYVNENICIVRKILKKSNDINLTIITRNDKDFKLSLREHKTNIQNIISRITQTGSDCVFCTSPTHLDYQIDPSYEPYVAEVSSIFPLPNSLFIDLYDKFRTFPLDRLYTFISEGNEVTGEKPGDTDPDHPNQLGNAYIAKVLLQEIFTIYFDPEKYIKSTLKGDKYPQY